MTFADRDDLQRVHRRLINLRPHLAFLPGGRPAGVRRRLVDQAAADADPFTLDYWRLNIDARKPEAAEQAA